LRPRHQLANPLCCSAFSYKAVALLGKLSAQRKVLSSAITADGSRVFSETEKRLIIHGEPVDPFFETEVAVFNSEGLDH
jgi:hypothetical protein